jgi:hypothetical protein
MAGKMRAAIYVEQKVTIITVKAAKWADYTDQGRIQLEFKG